jgi:hypothetical protein
MCSPHMNPQWIRYRVTKKALLQSKQQTWKLNQPVPALSPLKGDDPTDRSPEQTIRTYQSKYTQTPPSHFSGKQCDREAALNNRSVSDGPAEAPGSPALFQTLINN